ncbi:MAG: hypothetical protein KGI29_08580 [Pseudomonadota bacterium]|nr:hypothetical protein [Pseudomonadota bacterium]MDE3037809.1 hypothetical protein [Pseudomonadota bacterium]
MSKVTQNVGKWGKTGVPRKGWACVNVEDLGEPSSICEMCESQEIRYVHYMEHPQYLGTIGAGCVCAGKMEEDYAAAKFRETRLQNRTHRKSRWLSRKWRISNQGNFFINTDHFNIVIFENEKSWHGRIIDHISQKTITSKRFYATEEKAKLAAFDAMIFLKDRRN